jgi:hypothetical protein
VTTPLPPDSTGRRVVELDSRGRIAIGKFATHKQYILTVNSDDGTITLSPLAALLNASEYEQLTGGSRTAPASEPEKE